MATAIATVINETSFITKPIDSMLQLLKVKAIDRIDSVIDELAKYKKNLEALIVNFTIDKLNYLMNTILCDNDFTPLKIYTLEDLKPHPERFSLRVTLPINDLTGTQSVPI